MTYKEAWCKIVSEISNTYDDETKEALFMLAFAAKTQDDKNYILVPSTENLKEIKNMPINILDKDTWNANVIKTKLDEQKLR